MAVAPSRPDLHAHARVARMDFASVAEALRVRLGARLTAYIGKVNEPRAVHGWADGSRQPAEATRSACVTRSSSR